MYRADRDLVQTFTIRRKKAVSSRAVLFGRTAGQWVANAPFAVIEPRPRIGCSLGDQSEKVGNGAFKPNGGGMMACDRRKFARRARQRVDRDRIRRFVQHRQVDARQVRHGRLHVSRHGQIEQEQGAIPPEPESPDHPFAVDDHAGGAGGAHDEIRGALGKEREFVVGR